MPHIHEKIDFTVETFIVCKNKVLLRKHDKYKLWLSVGGHIELDDEPNQAAVREVWEEVGLKIKLIGEPIKVEEEGPSYHELLPPKFMNIHRISNTHRHIAMTYFAISDSMKISNNGDEKSDEIKWFDEKELDDPKYSIHDQVKKYARAALLAAKNL